MRVAPPGWIVLALALCPPAASAQDAGPGDADPASAAQPMSDLETARAHLAEGAFEQAIAILRRAHTAHPEDASVAQDLGYALARTGRLADAETLYRRAIALDPRRPGAYVAIAQLVGGSAARWQRQDEIVALLRRGLRGQDEDAQRQLQLALAGFERAVGRLAEARRALEPVLAPAVAPALRKQALDLLASITADEAALALRDWPEPALGLQDHAALDAAERHLRAGEPAAALSVLQDLLHRKPAATAARFARARALTAQGRHDEATRELTVLVQLRPSFARAWRLLGLLLAEHGGSLEAERADEALRRALALEPSWTDLRAVRAKVAARRDPGPQLPVAPAPPPPSTKALERYEEARRWVTLNEPEVAVTALTDALREAPTFVDAAVSLYALTGQLPETVPRALAETRDGAALVRLATQVLGLRRDANAPTLVLPWLDRAVALGVAEARYQRALLRADAGDRAGALDDLTAYVASAVTPPRLAEARALRATLLASTREAQTPREMARVHLLTDQPAEAERALGGPCREGMEPALLVELGRVREYRDELGEALACHRLAAGPAQAPFTATTREALTRIALIGARLPAAELERLEPLFRAAARANVSAAHWALSRWAAARGDTDQALAHAERFLATTPADALPAETANEIANLRTRTAALHGARARGRLWLLGAGAAVVLGALGAVLSRRFRGVRLERALARHPELYPELARAVAEVRHDVLKHRASALGLAASDASARSEVARSLHEPAPASAAVAAIYDRLRAAAGALGVTLRPLSRDPSFGPLAQDLARAEALLARPPGQAGEAEVLRKLDRALREEHVRRLTALLAAGPRTRLDPERLTRWIRAIESEGGGPDPHTRALHENDRPTPALHVESLDAEVAVTESAVATVLANLLRNAVAAVRGAGQAHVLVRVAEERDVTGRRLVALLVADSSQTRISLTDVDRRAGERGLGIVRDLVRRWGGHLVVRDEPPPLAKSIGAVFPATSTPTHTPE